MAAASGPRSSGSRVGIGVDEDEAGPGGDRDRVQVVIGGLEALGTLHAAGPGQGPVEAVDPGVVGARQGPGRAAAFGQRAAPVPADVDEAPHRAVVVAVSGAVAGRSAWSTAR